MEMKKFRQRISRENPLKGQIPSNPYTGNTGREEWCDINTQIQGNQ